MYPDIMKSCLRSIDKLDAKILDGQMKFIAKDGSAEIELYISSQKISYRVQGDAYITAMMKWLQMYILNNKKISHLNLGTLIKKFELPENKVRDAVLIMELIEQLK